MVLTCKSCGKKKRGKAAPLGASTRCGACKTALTPTQHLVIVGVVMRLDRSRP